MKGKDLIKLIQEDHLEDKEVWALVNINHGVFAYPIKEAHFSNNEDDCIFIETELIEQC